MKYSNELWAKCRWRIDNVPQGTKCYEFYPELANLFKPIVKAYSETDNGQSITLDLLIRYVVLTYHRFSPFAINEQNIIKRKLQVCELIGLNINQERTAEIIANKNRFVNNTAMYFLQQEGDLDWLELTMYLDAYYQIMGALTDGTVQDTTKTSQDIAKVKLGIVKEIKGIKSEIEQLSTKVFSDDNDLLNFMERYKRDEEEEFAVLSPEDYVKSKRLPVVE